MFQCQENITRQREEKKNIDEIYVVNISSDCCHHHHVNSYVNCTNKSIDIQYAFAMHIFAIINSIYAFERLNSHVQTINMYYDGEY